MSKKAAAVKPAVPLPPAVCLDANRHTCIRLEVTPRHVLFIPMAATGLNIEKLSVERFQEIWTVLPDYDVTRAARIYLDSPNARVITTSPKARDRLETLLTEDYSDASHHPQENDMESTNAAPAGKTAKPAAKKAAAPAKKGAAAPVKASTAKAPTKPKAAASKPDRYADKTITHKIKSVADAGLREGSGRAKMLTFVLKHTDTNKVLGQDVGDGKVIGGNNLAFMVDKGWITVK